MRKFLRASHFWKKKKGKNHDTTNFKSLLRYGKKRTNNFDEKFRTLIL